MGVYVHLSLVMRYEVFPKSADCSVIGCVYLISFWSGVPAGPPACRCRTLALLPHLAPVSGSIQSSLSESSAHDTILREGMYVRALSINESHGQLPRIPCMPTPHSVGNVPTVSVCSACSVWACHVSPWLLML